MNLLVPQFPYLYKVKTTDASVSIVLLTGWTRRGGANHQVAQLGQLSRQESTLSRSSRRDV